MTKILGALFGALLFFLLVSWAAIGLYTIAPGGHGDEGHAQGYVIAEIGEEGDEGHSDASGEEATGEEAVEEATGEEATGEEAVEEAVAEAIIGDPAAGEKVFKKCKACHKLEEGVKAVGPDLYGIVGRDVASREGFSYSAPMLEQGGTWDAARLDTFLTDPKGTVPGTKMSFTGLRKPADRANLIAYLEMVGG